VWLGFFLYEVLRSSAPWRACTTTHLRRILCGRGRALRESLEQHAGTAPVSRAYFDDGTPLGSADNVECQIDSISQSWSVLSGAGQRTRAHGHERYTAAVRREHASSGLLDPPSPIGPGPGYIKGYVPGVRETADSTPWRIWAAMAFAALGDSRRAWELTTMINPANTRIKGRHRDLQGGALRHGADVYAVAPHTGRGGWSWYTGSAGWMYGSCGIPAGPAAGTG